ncbi:MAG: hypothetical protein K8S23_07195 [Candidatus Cloacimonetes bacterium]|nr:hypothetical protein [Candidatus Cloacimonadota bacterium]
MKNNFMNFINSIIRKLRKLKDSNTKNDNSVDILINEIFIDDNKLNNS